MLEKQNSFKNNEIFQDDQINLTHLWNQFWNFRKQILICTFLITAIGTLFGYLYKNKAIVTAIISPPVITNDYHNNIKYGDNKETIKELIESGVFEEPFDNAFAGGDRTKGSFKYYSFRVELKEDIEALQITYPLRDVENGRVVMDTLLNVIGEYYQNKINFHQVGIESKINKLKSQIKFIYDEQKVRKKYVKLLEEQIENSKTIISDMNELNKDFVSGQKQLAKKNNNINGIHMALFTNYMNQQGKINYIKIKENISNLSKELKVSITEINEKEKDANDIQREIKRLETTKSLIQNVKYLKKPNLYKANKKIMLFRAFLLSFMAGIVISFCFMVLMGKEKK